MLCCSFLNDVVRTADVVLFWFYLYGQIAEKTGIVSRLDGKYIIIKVSIELCSQL